MPSSNNKPHVVYIGKTIFRPNPNGRGIIEYPLKPEFRKEDNKDYGIIVCDVMYFLSPKIIDKFKEDFDSSATDNVKFKAFLKKYEPDSHYIESGARVFVTDSKGVSSIINRPVDKVESLDDSVSGMLAELRDKEDDIVLKPTKKISKQQ